MVTHGPTGASGRCGSIDPSGNDAGIGAAGIALGAEGMATGDAGPTGGANAAGALGGIGWSITGMCPGPILVNIGEGKVYALAARQGIIPPREPLWHVGVDKTVI